MGQLERFTTQVFRALIADKYPHLQLPGVVCARVVSSKEITDTYEMTGLTITLSGGGDGNGTYEGTITGHMNEYTLQITDRWGNPDETFPVIPGIRSKGQFQEGCLVALGLMYGDVSPVILGEVEL